MKNWLIILLLLSTSSFAQNWTLKQCIDTALVNNYTLRTAHINTNISKINIRSAKQEMLPSFNGGATNGYNWGQTIDPFTNQFATNRVQYSNFYLNSSVVLFSGLQNYYGIQLSEIDYQSNQLNKKIEERNLKMEIAASYMQILLNNELYEVAEEHLQLTNVQIERTQLLIAAENKPQNAMLEIEAQKANDQYTILKAQNDLNYSLLLLQQSLGMPYDASFKLEKGDTVFEAKLLPKELDFSKSIELQVAELNMNKQSLKMKTTKGRLQPTLSVNGSLGSGYSGNSQYVGTNGEFQPQPFGRQLADNFYKSVSLSLSVPIFNKNSTRTQLQVNVLEMSQLQLDKEQKKLMVQNKIEQLTMDVSNANAQFQAARAVFSAAKRNFENSQIQYDNQVMNYSQLLEVKEKLFKAQSELIQAKYQRKFKELILSIYVS